MKIFLNEKDVTEKYLNYNKSLDEIYNDIINKVKRKDEIIAQIFINGKEFNEEYLLRLDNNDGIKTIKFVTKNIEDLTKETVNNAGEYLIKLKEGIKETADLFRQNDLEEANENYQLILEGFDWYLSVLSSLLEIIENEELINQNNNLLDEFNTVLKELMEAYENNDLVLVADILEYEISGWVNKFISFNSKISNKI